MYDATPKFGIAAAWTDKDGNTQEFETTVSFKPKKVGDNLGPVISEALANIGATKVPLNEAASWEFRVVRLPSETRPYAVESFAGIPRKVEAKSECSALAQVPGATDAVTAPLS